MTILQYVFVKTEGLVLESERVGQITETIIGQRFSDGVWYFDYKISNTLGRDYTGSYSVTNEYIRCHHVWEIDIRMPLEIGKEWDEFGYEKSITSFITPIWVVRHMDKFHTIDGEVADCVELAHFRQTSATNFWICPGIGIVDGGYSAPNSGYVKEWELLSIR